MLAGILACMVAVAAPVDLGLQVNDALPPATGATAPSAPLATNGPAVTIDAGVWIGRLTGTAEVGTGGTAFALNEDLAVGDMGVGAAGEFGVWLDRWRFGGVGFSFSAGEDQSALKAGVFGTTAIAVGDTIRGKVNAWMAGGEAAYVLWQPFADQPWPWSEPGANREMAQKNMGANGRPTADVRLLALAGGLVTGYDQTLENLTTGSTSEFESTVGALYGGAGAEILVGFDNRVPIIQDLRIYAYAGFGPTIPDADTVLMIRVGLAAMLTNNLGIEFGYRLFDFELQDGKSSVDGGIRGIFAAVSLKF